MMNEMEQLTMDTFLLGDLDLMPAPVEKPTAAVGPIAPAIDPHTLPKEETMSIPAALCDDLLLQELSQIPDKMGFKIGEVADLLAIKQYVLRYWETEFDILKPKKATNNQRMYTRKDVENAFLVRKLLHRDRFSIEGARSAMKELKSFVKKEREWSQVNKNFETYHEQADEIAADIQKLKAYFR